MILLTGATDGIGLALARQLTAVGQRALFLGRRPLSQLEAQLFTTSNYLQADLADENCAATVAEELKRRGVQSLRAVIHNAALGWFGHPAQQSDASIEELLNVNVRAPIALTRTLLPLLLKETQPQILFISSVASAFAAPEYALYTASKAALEGFARNLRLELGNKVRVQMFWPGSTRTGMHEKSGIPAERRAKMRFAPVEAVAAKIIQQLNQRTSTASASAGISLLRWFGTHLESVADATARPLTPLIPNPSTPEKLCAITGFADGIGKALALKFAGAGYKIVGIDFDAERAVRTQAEIVAGGGRTEFVHADLGRAAEIEKLFVQLRAHAPYSVFIHNAGINAVGRFAELELARQNAVLEINLRAPLRLTGHLLRENLMAENGSLVFVSSLSKYVGYPGASVYAAAKDGLAAYARSLSKIDGLHVLTVYPGPTRTAHARRYSPDNSRENRRMLPEILATQIYAATQK
ncbi:MAG: SDR family NAD(P)-dependent oxidoreductase, partial [Anaerolineales bacterium]|nr:SDR family NAD(P)-dependent oxidoreductase [Anaerolineales bacterium]